MELWRGITGFRDIDDPPLPATDFKKFSEHCHTAARSLGGAVRVLQEPAARAALTLRKPVTPDDCLQLSRAECEQIRYWRPRTVGEVLFNFWD